jgi:hypothetical protein
MVFEAQQFAERRSQGHDKAVAGHQLLVEEILPRAH